MYEVWPFIIFALNWHEKKNFKSLEYFLKKQVFTIFKYSIDDQGHFEFLGRYYKYIVIMSVCRD